MSLKQKCQHLKDELHKLKKQAASQPNKPPPEHKELEKIVFGKGSPESSSISPQKRSPEYRMRFYKHVPEEDDRDESDNVLPTQALLQNRTTLRQEIKEIKKISNVPNDYKSFLTRDKDDWESTQTTPAKSNRKLEDDENFALKRTMLAMAKTQKKEYPVLQVKGGLTVKNTNENFADVCNKIYNEKKESSGLKFKELIKQSRTSEH